MRSGTTTTRRRSIVGRSLVAWALVVAAACSGCRSCANDDGAVTKAAPDAQPAGPTMPAGMLVPAIAPGASEAGANANAAANATGVARHVKGGAWVELQLARPGDDAERREFSHWNDDSWFVSLEAMTALHEPFARALPGFDLFLPRLFSPEALARLGAELGTFARTADAALAKTASDLAQIATAVAAKNQGLWGLAPP